jgi:hypothetical protein
MKTLRALLLSGTALAITAQAGQNYNIHFPFRTPAGDMPAGKYSAEVRQLATSHYIELRNMETNSRVMLYPTNPVVNVNGAERGRMEFACAESGCDLKRMWRDGASGFDFRQKKLTPAEKERITKVRTESVAAE